MKPIEQAFKASDGALLHVGVFGPPAPLPRGRAQVLAIPAMMAGRRSFDRPTGAGLASALGAAGHRVFTLDLRGHGASGPPASRSRDWTYDDIVVRDIPAAVRHVRAQDPGAPLFILGHSLGAHAGAAAIGIGACGDAVDGIVLIGANIWTPALEPSPLHMLAKRVGLLAFDAVTRVVGRFPARALGMGSDDEPRSYVRAFPRWARGGWTSDDGRVDYLAALSRVTVPALALTASGDRLMCRAACARAFAAHLGAADVTVHEVGATMLGTSREPGHMTLVTDPRSRPAWALISRWLAERADDVSARDQATA